HDHRGPLAVAPARGGADARRESARGRSGQLTLMSTVSSRTPADNAPTDRVDRPGGTPEAALPPPPTVATPSTPRILVADDERSMRELLAIVLKREGYDV